MESACTVTVETTLKGKASPTPHQIFFEGTIDRVGVLFQSMEVGITRDGRRARDIETYSFRIARTDENATYIKFECNDMAFQPKEHAYTLTATLHLLLV